MNYITLKGNKGEVTLQGKTLIEAWAEVIKFLGGKLTSCKGDFEIYSFGNTWRKLPSNITGCNDLLFRVKLGDIASKQGFRAWKIDSCNFPIG